MKWIILACCVAVAFAEGSRRAVECHVDADCTCPNHGEIASCNQHMCQCSHDHGGGGRQAVQCHVDADCTCPNHGEIASCNHHMCECTHDHGGQGRQAVECHVDADCTCPNHGEIASCNHHMCQCSHDHGGVGKRENVACTNATTCDTHCAPNIGECKHDKCHCHHEHPARRAACTSDVDCVNCPHGTIAECDAHHQCQCRHDHGHPVGKRQVMCHNNAECTAHCSPHIGTCNNNTCHCHHH